MAVINFMASEVAPNMGIQEPAPEGWYNFSIKDSELKANKAGDGAVLTFNLQVMDGFYKGQQVNLRLNIRNKNEVAQRIALGQLSALCHAVNVLNVVDSTQLHGLPLKGKIKILFQEGYAPSNEFTAFRNFNEDIEVIQQKQDISELLESHKAPAVPAAPAPATAAAWNQQPAAPLAPIAPIAPVVQPLQQAPVQQAPIAPPVQQAPPAILGENAAPQQWAQPPVATVAPVQQAPVAPVAPAQPAVAGEVEVPAWMRQAAGQPTA